MMTVNDAVDYLCGHYGDLDAAARSLPVDPEEVALALSEAEPDTAEGIALRLLAKYNPYSPPTED